jgi:hypothetical protein
MPCSEYLSRDAPEPHGLREIPGFLQLSAAVPNSRFHVFLFEQTAAFILDLFRALPGLEYIADQPGPRGRPFAQRRSAAGQRPDIGASASQRSSLRRARRTAQLTSPYVRRQLDLPLGNRSIRCAPFGHERVVFTLPGLLPVASASLRARSPVTRANSAVHSAALLAPRRHQ